VQGCPESVREPAERENGRGSRVRANESARANVGSETRRRIREGNKRLIWMPSVSPIHRQSVRLDVAELGTYRTNVVGQTARASPAAKHVNHLNRSRRIADTPNGFLPSDWLTSAGLHGHAKVRNGGFSWREWYRSLALAGGLYRSNINGERPSYSFLSRYT